jgi:RHS repeat-associated protein
LIEENLHESQGVIEGLSGEGQITALLTYSEGTGSISSTFIIRLTAVASTGDLAFLPRSSAKLSLGSAPLLIQTSSSAGGSYSLIATANETEGEFSEINASTGEFSFFGAVQSGLATAEVTYTLGTEAITAIYVIEVEPRKAISRVSASFGGAIRDRTSGYLWMRSRYYDPVLGRFLSRDPAEDDSLSNDYTPFENNPANYRDPSGEIVQAVVGALITNGLNYGIQYYRTEGFTTGQYNKKQGLLSTIGGALSGIISGGLEEKIPGEGLAKNVLRFAIAYSADVAVGTAEEVALSVWQQGSFAGVSWKGIGYSALDNAVVSSFFLAPSVVKSWLKTRRYNKSFQNLSQKGEEGGFIGEMFKKTHNPYTTSNQFYNVKEAALKHPSVQRIMDKKSKGVKINLTEKSTRYIQEFHEIDIAARDFNYVNRGVLAEEIQHAIDRTNASISKETLKRYNKHIDALVDQYGNKWNNLWHAEVFDRIAETLENNFQNSIFKNFLTPSEAEIFRQASRELRK